MYLYFSPFLFLIIMFIYFLAVLGLHCQAGFALDGASRDYSRCLGVSLRWLLLLRAVGSGPLGSVVAVPELESTGSVVVA